MGWTLWAAFPYNYRMTFPEGFPLISLENNGVQSMNGIFSGFWRSFWDNVLVRLLKQVTDEKMNAFVHRTSAPRTYTQTHKNTWSICLPSPREIVLEAVSSIWPWGFRMTSLYGKESWIKRILAASRAYSTFTNSYSDTGETESIWNETNAWKLSFIVSTFIYWAKLSNIK